jgi:hypothetical protein
MKRSCPLIVLVTLGLAVLPVPAAVLHVDQADPRAADANPGTPEQPLRTISAAIKGLHRAATRSGSTRASIARASPMN